MPKRKTQSTNTLIRKELRRIMEERGITQRTLCEKTDLWESYLSAFMNGRRGMRVETLEAILKVLKVKRLD